MPSKNIISKSIKESFHLVSKNKKTFLLIFALQILFFFLLITINSFYTAKIIDSTQNVMEYLDAVNFNEEKARIDVLQKKNPFGEDPLLISKNYNEIIKNFISLLLLTFLLFIIINGLIWYLASNIGKKSLFRLKGIAFFLLKFFVVSLILSVFVYLFLFNLIKVSFSSFLSTEPNNLFPLLTLTIVAIYFIYIAIPLVNNLKNNKKEVKKFVKKIFSIGIKKFILILASYLILILIILTSYSIAYFIESNLFMLFISIILFLFVFSWTKIFFSLVVRELI